MEKVESIEEFYQRKFNWIPENLRNEIGHFNVFRLEPFVGENASPVPYKRRDYYKVMLCRGGGRIHYADKILNVNKLSLTFSNPQIPYKWEHTEEIESGYFCVFNQHFFHQYGNLNQYAVFQPGGVHIFELDEQQAQQVSKIYENMFKEFASDYIYKFDVLRNLVFELLHFAMKIQPAGNYNTQNINASKRISTVFLELLERQFPIDETHRQIQKRTASDFAKQLNVHVNHLNRAIKETAGKTTTQIISERIMQEAKIILKQSDWNVAEVSEALGFTEVTHFNNFFKKHCGVSPMKFRKL